MKKNGKIAYRLIAAFLIPVFMIILLGVLSYSKSSKDITRQYEKSTAANLEALSLYLDLLCDTVESRATETVTGDAFSLYYVKYANKNNSEAMEHFREVKRILQQIRGTTDYIGNYAVFSEKGGNIVSGSEVAHGEAYKEFAASEEAKKISSGKGTWSGYHHFLDEKGITKEDDYAIAYTRTLAKGNGYLFFDIKAEILQNILENITTKKGIIAAVVTEDGREILQDSQKNPEEAVFFGKDYFEKAAAGGEAGSTYISYQGDKYLYSFVPIGMTGLMLCVLTPKSVLLESANSIGITTIIMVIAASIIAMLIGSIMARNIGREVKNLSGSLNHVSEGDFTTEFQSKRKDEFLILARGMTAMLEKLRSVFMTIRDFAGKVDASSSDVSKASEHMLGSMQKIRLAMEDVTSGADRQLSDVRDGMEKMSVFSDRLNDAFAYTREIEESSVKTMEVVNDGRKLADQLNTRTEETVVMTNRLTEHIAEVAENSKDIESIVGTIQAIAEQTDLLSLNASIEAARSGNAGRGFGVVAGDTGTDTDSN